jgi:hypothetical protein
MRRFERGTCGRSAAEGLDRGADICNAAHSDAENENNSPGLAFRRVERHLDCRTWVDACAEQTGGGGTLVQKVTRANRHAAIRRQVGQGFLAMRRPSRHGKSS